MNSKLSIAIAAVLGALSGARSLAATAEGGSDALEEITVTAQRRAQSMQEVPISMQAFTGQALQQLNIQTFDDYIKYLPNVTSANNGPGQNEVFMRGLSAGSQASQGSSSTGLFPNVAIYLDNQSGQLPNRNLDIYAADLNRIEVLEGPQGTLFGAGAEAGVIRYITNEPKIDVTEANVKAGYGTTAHGDNNSDVTAVLNLPLMPEHMAVRAVIYNDQRGGYIDNVPATFTRKNTDLGIHYAGYPAVNGQCPDGLPNNGFCVPPGSPTLNNNSIAGRAINPVTYQGIRAQLLYKFNDDWDVLLAQSYQDMHSQGVFYQQPNASDGAPLRPLEVTLFNPSYDNDKFEMTSLTIDGKLGFLKGVYTAGYLSRSVEQSGDYTNYSRAVYAEYYQCYGAFDLTPKCFSPNASWHTSEQNKHFQNEFRVSTPDEWRVRGIVGAFYEDNKLSDRTAWSYKGIPECTATLAAGCFTDLGTFPGSSVNPAGIRPATESFYQDTPRETKQTAFFASVDFDLIPKVLTLTAGTRHFLFENSYKGSTAPISPGTSCRTSWCITPGRKDSGRAASMRMEARDISTGRTASCNTCCRAHGIPTSSRTTRSAGKPSSSTIAFSGMAPSTVRTGTMCRSPSSIPVCWATCSSIQTGRTSWSKASKPRSSPAWSVDSPYKGRPPGIKLDRRIRRR